MSFAGLQSARKNKESKSFVTVNSGSVPEKSEPVKDSDAEAASAARHDGPGKLDIDRLKGLPDAVEIRQSSIEGRGIFANVFFQPGKTLILNVYAPLIFCIGTVVSSMRPRVTVLSTSTLDTFCSHCCSPAPETGLKRCTRCKVLYYCDAVCEHLICHLTDLTACRRVKTKIGRLIEQNVRLYNDGR